MERNVSGASGGGVFAAGEVAITGVRLGQNQAQGSAGALYVASSGSADIERSSFQGHGADGAGAIESAGVLELTGSTIEGSSSNYGRSAVTIADGSASITNSTIAGNRNEDGFYASGGGLQVRGNAELSILNTTITGNYAPYDGFYTGIGGIDIRDQAQVQIANSIVTGNLGEGESSIGQNDVTGDFVSLGGNIFGDIETRTVLRSNDRASVEAEQVFRDIDLIRGDHDQAFGGALTFNEAPRIGPSPVLTAALLDTLRGICWGCLRASRERAPGVVTSARTPTSMMPESISSSARLISCPMRPEPSNVSTLLAIAPTMPIQCN